MSQDKTFYHVFLTRIGKFSEDYLNMEISPEESSTEKHVLKIFYDAGDLANKLTDLSFLFKPKIHTYKDINLWIVFSIYYNERFGKDMYFLEYFSKTRAGDTVLEFNQYFLDKRYEIFFQPLVTETILKKNENDGKYFRVDFDKSKLAPFIIHSSIVNTKLYNFNVEALSFTIYVEVFSYNSKRLKTFSRQIKTSTKDVRKSTNLALNNCFKEAAKFLLDRVAY